MALFVCRKSLTLKDKFLAVFQSTLYLVTEKMKLRKCNNDSRTY